MAEHEFSDEAKAHFREICQESAWKRGLANFGRETPEMREWYEWAWRANYADYVGERVVLSGERCDHCGMVVQLKF